MLQIADGVSYLHSKNLVYCDLKPTRLMTCQCSSKTSKSLDLALQKYLVFPLFRDLRCIHFSKPICFLKNSQKKLHLAEHLPIDAAYYQQDKRAFTPLVCSSYVNGKGLCGATPRLLENKIPQLQLAPFMRIMNIAYVYILSNLTTAATRVSTLTLKPKP
jgi:serine/threonine protein kinase